jgi:hypothetical protein
MKNITNKELGSLYTAIFLLEHQRDEVAESIPISPDEADASTWMLYNDLDDAIEGLKELGKVLRDIRKSQLKGYHA